MTGIITSIPPLVEQPPGNNSNNPAGLPGVTYTVAVLNIPQTWTALQTYTLGSIFAGSTSGNTFLNATAIASGTVLLPAVTGTDTLLANNNTATVKNKSIDGLQNTLTNIPAASFGSTTGTGAVVLSNSPVITTPTGIVKGDVGLGNVDNTSDANKPVSTAQATALALKANLASPTFTGTPAAPTAAVGTNTTQLATTAFVLANAPTSANAPAISALDQANVSGSASTTTGTISASSSTLTLASALDFKNGQGIRVNHAGAAFTPGAPTALTITPTGTAGSTAYSYTIAPIDAIGGVGAAIATVATATGNAALSVTNYNALSWTAASGSPAGYAVYGRTAGSLTLLAITPGTTFWDMGSAITGTPTAPDWLPSTPPATALASWLVTSISSGGGTTTLTLAATATTAATSQTVLHDDTVALQAAINTASSTQNPLYLNPGTYRISSQLTSASGSLHMFGSGMAYGKSAIALSSVTQNGLVLSSSSGFNQLHDFSMLAAGGGVGGVFQIAGAFITATGFAGDTFERVSLANCFNGIINTRFSIVYNRLLIGCAGIGIDSTSANDSLIVNSDINPLTVPGGFGAWGVRLQGDAGGMRIANNKMNAGGFGYDVGINVVHSTSDAVLLIEGNSIEGWTVDGVVIGTQGAATLANVIISGNEIAYMGGSIPRCIYLPNANNQISNVVISNNVLSSFFHAIEIVQPNGVSICGNAIANAAVGVTIGTTATNCSIGVNTYTAVTTNVNDASRNCTSPIAVVKVQKFTASGTYTPSVGLLYAVIECVGGGASGGSTTATAAGQTSVSSGGGGGSYARKISTAAAIGASQTVTIGAGGASPGAGANGNAGGTTSVGALCSAGGGGGGFASGASTAVYVNGGDGGAATVGDLLIAGQAANPGFGITSPNPNGFGSNGGASGLGFGSGGKAVLNAPGAVGQNYGAGGGGNLIGASTAAQGGGAGAPGLVIITEYTNQ